MARKSSVRNRRPKVSPPVATRRKARVARVPRGRSAGLSSPDKRILGLASRIIEEDQGLLRRLAER